MKKKMIKPFVILLSVGLLTIASWQLFQYKTSAEPLTEGEAKNIVNDMYKGEIQGIKKTEQGFTVTIKLSTGIYGIQIDRQSGDVLGVSRHKVTEQAAKQEPKPSKRENGRIDKNPSPNIIITKEEASEIAQDEVNGEIDDIDFEEEDGVSYYFVEIERSDGMEATIQINAVTGEVKTITWDD